MNANYHLEKCVRCGLDCELAQEHKRLVQKSSGVIPPYYATRHLENCVVDKYYEPMSCGSKYIADGIGDDFKINVTLNTYNKTVEYISDYKTKWTPQRPVCISAQTGQGKNFFIENTLLPYVKEMNYKKQTDFKVLIISNRIALRMQIQQRLHGRGLQDNEDELFPYSDSILTQE